MKEPTLPEPWLRGTHQDVLPVPRSVLHALELAREDLTRWCHGLSDEEFNARPRGIAPVAFHMKHIARSIDRLLTYAEGDALSERQMLALKSEMDGPSKLTEVFVELETALERTSQRVRRFDVESLDLQRMVGRKGLPTTAAGLLIHIAEHTQRHVGQAITTAKIVREGFKNQSAAC
jgi:uncharacterized damage-inducible protein DinB